MLVGLERVDITPDIGLPMGGNVREDNASRGIHDPLYANIIVMRDRDENAVCFVELDVLGVDRQECFKIKRGINQSMGIPEDAVVVNAIHTHSGPDMVRKRKDDLPDGIKRYLDELVGKVIHGAKQAWENMTECKIGVGRGYEDSLSFNRRIWLKDGTLHMNWEDISVQDIDRSAGPIDHDVFVIKITDMQEKCIGVMVNFTMHAAVLVGRDWLYSRDFINGLDNRIKEKLGKDTLVYFANGAEGNINHIDIWNKEQGRDFDEADRIGRVLADNILYFIDDIEVKEDMNIRVSAQDLKMPIRDITDQEIQNAKKLVDQFGDKKISLKDGVPEVEFAKQLLRIVERKQKCSYILTHIQAIKIGEAAIITFPAEVFAEFQLKLKEISPYRYTTVFGLANGYHGYIPVPKAFDEGGYEPITGSGILAEDAGDIWVNTALQMIKKLT